MKQVLEQLRTGEIEVADVPAPGPAPGRVLIRTTHTVISAGTERMLVEFGRASLLRKARSQPDRVRDVLDKLRADGVLPTLEAVFRKLDEPIPLGYCHAGVVVDGGGTPFAPGDRVASNGPHAEFASVPRRLCAAVPEGVPGEDAAFTALGAIALQGIRLAAPSFGERVVVIGLGLVGQLAVQLLRAAGCEVMGIDLRSGRLDLAARFGARVADAGAADPVRTVGDWSGGAGADAVLIAASAAGDEVARQAARMCRRRGRVVLVGVVGLGLRRDDFYRKEITFQVSCSYGPGRYDPRYEEGGHDYPAGFVRWTEQRNFEAVLAAMARGDLDVKPLVSARFELARAEEAYRRVAGGGEALGVVLACPGGAEEAPARAVEAAPPAARRKASPAAPVLAVAGAGAFARGVLLPALRGTRARLKWIVSRSGAPAAAAARRFGAERAGTDWRAVLDDPEVNGVVLAVRHDAHARMVCEALAAGKHVFVEKPLCLTGGELAGIARAAGEAASSSGALLMAGFNRRFSPHTARVARGLARRAAPVSMVMTVNAGAVPADAWIRDPAVGGGRIVGEACHFIDLLAHLAGAPVREVVARASGASGDPDVSIGLALADGSAGTVHYLTGGARGYPKEVLQVFGGGRVTTLGNFRVTRSRGPGAGRAFRTWRQDKGHGAELRAFVEAVASGGPSPTPFDSLVNTTRATLAAVRSAASGEAVRVDPS